MNQKYYTSFEAILCYALIVSLFMNWVSFGFIGEASALDIASFGGKLAEAESSGYFFYLIYLIPVSAVLILFAASNPALSENLLLMKWARMIPFIVVAGGTFYLFLKMDISLGDFFEVTNFGFYLAFISSLLLFIKIMSPANYVSIEKKASEAVDTVKTRMKPDAEDF